MKIRLAILESDTIYLERIVAYFDSNYADKLELYSFSNMDIAISCLEKSKIDVFLADDYFDINIKNIPDRCGFAYLVDSMNIESIRGEKAICKYQKAELIYKQVLSIFSEKTSVVSGVNFDETNKSKVIAFLSPAGGTGCSIAAAACAKNLASKNKKVLYLNFEMFGDSNIFFESEGNGTFSDIIFAIKSKKGNLPLKLESLVKHDSSGVYYYTAANMALDMAELTVAEIKKLITDIKLFCGYDYIIIDMDFSLEKTNIGVLCECNSIVIVSDGSTVCNGKIVRAIESLNVIDEQYDYKLLLRCSLLYNRFSSVTSQKIVIDGIKELGGIKRYEGYTVQQLLDELSSLSVFDCFA